MDKKIEWDGKGLPPVGSVVEYTGYCHGLKPGAHVEIIHHFDAGVSEVAAFIYRIEGSGKYVGQSIAGFFKPVGTDAQPEPPKPDGELLAALELAAEALEHSNPAASHYREAQERHGNALSQARAAISKAKGGAV